MLFRGIGNTKIAVNGDSSMGRCGNAGQPQHTPSKSLSFAKTSIVTGVFFAVVAVSLFTIILSLDGAATDTCGRDEVFDSLPNVPTGKQSATRSRRVSMVLITLKLLFCLSCVHFLSLAPPPPITYKSFCIFHYVLKKTIGPIL